MIVSEARIAANRRNALRSSGPKTEAGKGRSRANALKHGLCSLVVVAEDSKTVQERVEDFGERMQPKDEFEGWLVSQVALLSIRIERAGRIERTVRDKIALRAEVSWESDRRLEAARLGSTLGERPEEVIEVLCQTPQGCEWLMGRWAMLAHSADIQGSWTAGQARLAFDLLGTPADFREGHEPGTSLDFDGRVVADGHDPAGVARREITALKARRELVEGLDEAKRSLAGSDLADDDSPELRRLRRYEASLQGRIRWCLAQLGKPSPTPKELPTPPAPRPSPTPRQSPEIEKIDVDRLLDSLEDYYASGPTGDFPTTPAARIEKSDRDRKGQPRS